MKTVETYRDIATDQGVDAEITYTLEYSWSPIQQATRTDPECGGVEPENLYEGELEVDIDEPFYAEILDELVQIAYSVEQGYE